MLRLATKGLVGSSILGLAVKGMLGARLVIPIPVPTTTLDAWFMLDIPGFLFDMELSGDDVSLGLQSGRIEVISGLL